MKQANPAPVHCLGVGIDTARYGHHVSFLRDDKRPARPALTITESRSGYQRLQQGLDRLHRRYPDAPIYVRIDAAGQYAYNLETFLRSLDLPLSVSVGEPKRNKDYRQAHFPKRKADPVESLEAEKAWKELLEKGFDALPDGKHSQIETILGIGKLTAAAIVATAIDIDWFTTEDDFVGYYGVFPEECSSGVDKFGRPLPAGKKRMCRKGNDLVRGLLWNCAKNAAKTNPTVRAFYARSDDAQQKAAGLK